MDPLLHTLNQDLLPPPIKTLVDFGMGIVNFVSGFGSGESGGDDGGAGFGGPPPPPVPVRVNQVDDTVVPVKAPPVKDGEGGGGGGEGW